MKWWHRWRHRVWSFRYFTARGMLEKIREAGLTHTARFDELVAECATTASAAEYHYAQFAAVERSEETK